MLPKDFYPTPQHLIRKMLSKIDPVSTIRYILEPSAGKGDIINAIQSNNNPYIPRQVSISAIEVSPEFQSILRGMGVNVIDSNFLLYSGLDKFDLILMNPPFSEGDKHLLKAIDIMYRGQIICLLNTETLKNTYSNTRKLLSEKLNDLNASVEWIEDAFKDAERKASVDVALISIKIDRSIDDSIFNDVRKASDESINVDEEKAISIGKNSVKELVDDYNQTIEIGQNLILTHAKYRKRIGKFIILDASGEQDRRYYGQSDNPVSAVRDSINSMIKQIRVHFWRRALNLDVINKRLTVKKREEFEQQLSQIELLDFTENNIRQFILNVIDGYSSNIQDAVLDIFDKLTIKHTWHEKLNTKNIHFFNGWKTNKAFKVNHRVVLPVYGSLTGSSFRGFGSWRLDYRAAMELDDIDTVMNYFDGMRNYTKLSDAFKTAFEKGDGGNLSESSVGYKVESTYFTATAYKKGTVHLTFRNKDILRRFNIEACKGKGWLPQDYGHTPFKELPSNIKDVVRSFDDSGWTYDQKLGNVGIEIDPKKLLN